MDEKRVWLRLTGEREVHLNDPVLIVSVSTSVPQYRMLYSQARQLATYMLKKLHFEHFASLYASALPPAFLIREDGTAGLVGDRFYHHAGKRDIVLFAGDSAPVDEQYEFVDAVLSYAKSLGVKEIFSIGARWTNQPILPVDVPKVLGFSTDLTGVQDLMMSGVQIMKDEPAPFFASLVVGRAELYAIRGYKLSVDHGEPFPHPKSVTELLRVLGRMIGFEIDVGELEEEARRMPEVMGSNPQTEARPGRDEIYH